MAKNTKRLPKRAYYAHAEDLDRETEALLKAGYFDEVGCPRTDVEGKKIWNEVQRQLKQAEESK